MSWVWGAGSSMFGPQPEASTADLVWAAVKEAMRDADVFAVDAVFAGSCFGEPGVVQRALWGLGVTGIPILRYENACASSSTAFHEAQLAVESGRFGSVLVLGIEHLTSRYRGAIPVEQRDVEGRSGLALPALYAMTASRYMDVFGLTEEQLVEVSVKNHRNGALNPRAGYGRPVTAAQVRESRMIAEPLTLLQCCGISDGAAALVLAARGRGERDVRVVGTELWSGQLWNQSSNHAWGYELARDTARRLFDRAGVGPLDMDLFEVHDAFTIGEIVTTEALGLAAEGQGGELLSTGWTTLGGRHPVNPSGGLLSRGHPLGATGAAQVVEVVAQLRGEAGARQVEKARLGLVETLGGGVGGIDGNACFVGVLASN